MNKGRRNELRKLKYKKRIRLMANTADIYISRDGKHIYKPKTIDLLKDNAQNCYRDQSTPCSCPMCSRPDLKYNRAKEKQNRRKEIVIHNQDIDYVVEKYGELIAKYFYAPKVAV